MGCNHLVGYWWPGASLVYDDDLLRETMIYLDEDGGSVVFHYCPICGEKLEDYESSS